MESNFEIGEIVTWKINDLIECRGAYLCKLDSVFSEVKCHFRNDKVYICKLKVLTEILKKGK